MTPEQAEALRAAFPATAVGKLPKPTRRDAQPGKCPDCGGWHGLPAVHLDYVGHAAVTDRLLAVDPEWNWEPLALDDAGLPRVDRFGGLWIRLTVCGVTRLGYGEAGAKEPSGQTMKELISDALRNAAMRFGVALDLWSKEDLHAQDAPEAPARSNARPGHAVDAAREAMGISQPGREEKQASTKQLKLLEDKVLDKGYANLLEFLPDAEKIVGHTLDLATLNSRDASKLIDALLKYEKTEGNAQWERINTRRASGASFFPNDDPWAGEPIA